MMRLLAAVTLTVAVLPLGAQSNRPDYAAAIARLAADFATPAVAFAVVEPDTTIELLHGTADVAAPRPLARSSLFRVVSISKPVTALTIMRLAEAGRIDLDAPITRYVRGWTPPASQWSSDQVTVRRVLDHSAGLSTEFGPGFTDADSLPSLPDMLAGRSPARRQLRVVYQPGSDHQYSNLGYGLLQLLVEEVTGESFAEVVRREVFAPLDMGDSQFGDPRDPAVRSLMVTAHDWRMQPIEPRRFVALGAAGLLTSLADLTTLARAELGRDRLVTPQGWEMLWADQGNGGWGLGHLTRRDATGHRYVGHTGLEMGWNAAMQVDPDAGSALVVLTNGDNGYYIHSALTCLWFHAHHGTRVDACRVAPDKKLNAVELQLEMAVAAGRVNAASGQTLGEALARARQLLRSDSTAAMGPLLRQLEDGLVASAGSDAAVRAAISDAFTGTRYWLDQAWFTE